MTVTIEALLVRKSVIERGSWLSPLLREEPLPFIPEDWEAYIRDTIGAQAAQYKDHRFGKENHKELSTDERQLNLRIGRDERRGNNSRTMTPRHVIKEKPEIDPEAKRAEAIARISALRDKLAEERTVKPALTAWQRKKARMDAKPELRERERERSRRKHERERLQRAKARENEPPKPPKPPKPHRKQRGTISNPKIEGELSILPSGKRYRPATYDLDALRAASKVRPLTLAEDRYLLKHDAEWSAARKRQQYLKEIERKKLKRTVIKSELRMAAAVGDVSALEKYPGYFELNRRKLLYIDAARANATPEEKDEWHRIKRTVIIADKAQQAFNATLKGKLTPQERTTLYHAAYVRAAAMLQHDPYKTAYERYMKHMVRNRRRYLAKSGKVMTEDQIEQSLAQTRNRIIREMIIDPKWLLRDVLRRRDRAVAEKRQKLQRIKQDPAQLAAYRVKRNLQEKARRDRRRAERKAAKNLQTSSAPVNAPHSP